MNVIRLIGSRIVYASAIVALWLLAVGCLSHGAPPVNAKLSGFKEAGMEQGASLNDDATRPDPKLSPEEVILIVLRALQHNDTPKPDSGIATTFKFASPANKEATGPLERFIQLVKNPLYIPMLNHRRAERGAIKIAGDFAQQKVTLIDAQGRRAVYVFILSKQKDEPCKNCWMTDGVTRVPDDETETNKVIAAGNGQRQSI